MDNVAPLCCLLQVSSSMESCNDVGMGGREVLKIICVFFAKCCVLTLKLCPPFSVKCINASMFLGGCAV